MKSFLIFFYYHFHTCRICNGIPFPHLFLISVSIFALFYSDESGYKVNFVDLFQKNQLLFSFICPYFSPGLFFFFFKRYFFKKNLFIYLFLAVLGLRFCARAFSSCSKRGPLFVAVHGPLTIVASLVAEHRLQMCRLSSWLMGLVALRHVGSSQTRARTHVPCIGRQILNHCATREALPLVFTFIYFYSLLFSVFCLFCI